MPTSWTKTALSFPSTTDSPNPRPMSDTTRETLSFGLGFDLTADSFVTLTRLDTKEEVTAPITNKAVIGQLVNVTVSGLTRGVTYELEVTFVGTNGRRVARTLVLECVS